MPSLYGLPNTDDFRAMALAHLKMRSKLSIHHDDGDSPFRPCTNMWIAGLIRTPTKDQIALK
jgi:hypothetical protein